MCKIGCNNLQVCSAQDCDKEMCNMMMAALFAFHYDNNEKKNDKK